MQLHKTHNPVEGLIERQIGLLSSVHLRPYDGLASRLCEVVDSEVRRAGEVRMSDRSRSKSSRS